MKTSQSNSSAIDTEFQVHQLRSRVLASAQALYLNQGIQAVAMSDVAVRLGISTVVLSKEFTNKHALVHAVVAMYADRIRRDLIQQKEWNTNAVGELLALLNWVREEREQVRGPFFQELKQHYPISWQLWQQYCTDFFMPHLHSNLRRGMLEGLYRSDLDLDFMSRLLFQELRIVQSPSNALLPGLEPQDVQQKRLVHFLSGIVTPVGAFVAQRLQEFPPDCDWARAEYALTNQ